VPKECVSFGHGSNQTTSLWERQEAPLRALSGPLLARRDPPYRAGNVHSQGRRPSLAVASIPVGTVQPECLGGHGRIVGTTMTTVKGLYALDVSHTPERPHPGPPSRRPDRAIGYLSEPPCHYIVAMPLTVRQVGHLELPDPLIGGNAGSVGHRPVAGILLARHFGKGIDGRSRGYFACWISLIS
jgi:hypothetical protein